MSISHRPKKHHGTVLVVTLWIIIILTGMVLVFARSMRVQALASANEMAATQAGAIERGAEQFVLALIDLDKEQSLTLPETNFQAVQVGDGYFWIIRPNYGDERLPSYGLVDEASKLNLNSATEDMLSMLPGMPTDLPPAIADWRDTDSNTLSGGAENDYYLSLPHPYNCKNGPLETVEELLLIRGMTPALLYGQTSAGLANLASPWSENLSAWSAQAGTDAITAHGLFDYLTVYSIEPSTSRNGGQTNVTGKININTAPREVLLCLPGLTDADVSSIISQRSTSTSDSTDISWVSQVLGAKAGTLNRFITGRALQYSADIVAVSGNGRAFKRCRIVVDARNSPPQIIYRKDLTEAGWPMDRNILSALRNGTGMPSSALSQPRSF